MTPPEESSNTPGDLEDAFLQGLEARPLPFAGLLDILLEARNRGLTNQADSWAELLQDTLAEHENVDKGLELLCLRASWCPADSGFRTTCRRIARAILAEHRSGEAFVESAGFDGDTPTHQCIERIIALTTFDKGVLCFDRTWGFGVIDRVDSFYKRITVDFDGKAGHEMSFAYAAESLELIDEDHLLSRNYREPAKLRELIDSDPAEVARIALRSYGPMSAQRLQETLAPAILPEAEWKGFWVRARKALKDDPFIEFPSKRTNPIMLRDSAKGYDESWFEQLKGERDLAAVVSRLEDLAGHGWNAADADPSSREAVDNRVRFLVTGAGDKDLALITRAMMSLEKMNIETSPEQKRILSRILDNPDLLASVGNSLPARTTKPFLAYMFRFDRDRALASLPAAFGPMSMAFLNETMTFLCDAGHEDACRRILRDAMAARNPSLEMLYWVGRRLDVVADWSLGSNVDIAGQLLAGLESTDAGHRTATAKLVRSLFEKKEWLRKLMDPMPDDRRRDLLLRARESTGWSAVDKNSLLARIISLYPDLQEALATSQEADEHREVRSGITSWRSYREREKLLEKLEKVDIPQNSREIAQARSYGDLSENHAFKAAKEHQSILLDRRDQVVNELRSVKGSTFEGMRTDVVGVGTRVLYRTADGTGKECFVLGEWDTDPDLAILSCRAPLADCLLGLAPGDETTTPDNEPITILDISPLPPDILCWAKA